LDSSIGRHWFENIGERLYRAVQWQISSGMPERALVQGLENAREKLENWHRDDKEGRPHGATGYDVWETLMNRAMVNQLSCT
jgi:hypothetical protein